MDEGERPHKIRKVMQPGEEHVVENANTATDIQDHLSNGDQDLEQKSPINGYLNVSEGSKTDLVDEGRDEITTLPLPEEVAPMSVDMANGDTHDPPLSKNQLKKLRKKAEWEAGREERKVIRKEKLIAKRERKQAFKQQQVESGVISKDKSKRPQPPKPVQLPVTFLIDCDFDDLMRDNERISLASQLTRCYSDNKNARFRAHITICSFGGKLKERFDTVLTKNYQSWRGVRTFDCDFVEAAEKAKQWMTADAGGVLRGHFAKYDGIDDDALAKLKDEGEVVYLTSEGDVDLTELKPYSTYIIGGLVDKNREKGICYKRAKQRGIKTARLPIGQFMAMQSRKVLTTNHVNEIMVHWLESGDWGAAFLRAIPKRKGGTLKDTPSDMREEGEDETEEDLVRDDGAV